jgi:GNAT superfamily N-acetyltransferase
MQTIQLDTSRARDVRRFVRFPFDLYRNCPQWVPPLVSSAKAMLDRTKHPYYEHSEADFFLVEQRGRTLGRIAAMHNRRYNQFTGSSDAFFGFFDAVDDTSVSRALFDAVLTWARERNLTQVKGPRALIGADASGVLVEGFEHRPALNVPYNHPYYDRMVVDSGLVKDTDHLSGYFPGDHEVPDRVFRIADRVRARGGYRVKAFEDKEEMRAWVPRVREIYRRSFGGNHSFYPPTEAEMEAMADTIIGVTRPGMIKLVLQDDELIGFAFSYPDLSAGLQRAKGRLWPLGWLHLLRESRRTEWANCNGIGVLPEHQGLGPSILLYAETVKTLKAMGFKHADVVMVDERNFNSFSAMEALGVTWYKRHRSYWRNT